MAELPLEFREIDLHSTMLLSYHRALAGVLRRQHAELWQWCAAQVNSPGRGDAVRFELLKSTCRLEQSSHADLYAQADAVGARLGLDLPVTLYQAADLGRMNASLADIPGEAHLVLEGPLLEKLTREELAALLAHELSHALLRQAEGGEPRIAEEVLWALTADNLSEAVHEESARLWQLYTEIFCDRGSLTVAGDPLLVVATLLKTLTGLEEVDPAGFFKQSAEALEAGPSGSAGLTHPEAAFRAAALKLWAEKGPEAESLIGAMIQGRPRLDSLDLVGQEMVADRTRRLVDCLLGPSWMRTEPVLAHARRFFEEYVPPEGAQDGTALATELAADDPSLVDYYLYVVLDFVSVDRSLEEAALAWGLTLAERLGAKDRFTPMLERELRLRKRQWETIDREKEQLLAAAGNEAAR